MTKLKKGDKAPDFSCPDENGNIIYSFVGAADWSNPKVVDQLKKLVQP